MHPVRYSSSLRPLPRTMKGKANPRSLTSTNRPAVRARFGSSRCARAPVLALEAAASRSATPTSRSGNRGRRVAEPPWPAVYDDRRDLSRARSARPARRADVPPPGAGRRSPHAVHVPSSPPPLPRGASAAHGRPSTPVDLLPGLGLRVMRTVPIPSTAAGQVPERAPARTGGVGSVHRSRLPGGRLAGQDRLGLRCHGRAARRGEQPRIYGCDRGWPATEDPARTASRGRTTGCGAVGRSVWLTHSDNVVDDPFSTRRPIRAAPQGPTHQGQRE